MSDEPKALTSTDPELDPFRDQVVIKTEPELRHVLSHLWNAVDALANGRPYLARAELKSIEGLVFYEDEAEAEVILRAAAERGETDGEMHEAEADQAEATQQVTLEGGGVTLPPAHGGHAGVQVRA